MYQPIVELETGTRTSVEALVRWNHPTLGAISPAEFMPVAEESGLIVPARGSGCCRKRAGTLARWREPIRYARRSAISVNISRAELAQGAPPARRACSVALTIAGLPPDSLQLEVTEREVMRDPDATLRADARRCASLGVRLAMDDFGTGTSSLGCLRDYPFDVIKIDRSFVTDLAADPDVLAVIHATITLVENLGKTSVAEGVEDRRRSPCCSRSAADYAQGYYFSRPMSCDEICGFMALSVAERVEAARA